MKILLIAVLIIGSNTVAKTDVSHLEQQLLSRYKLSSNEGFRNKCQSFIKQLRFNQAFKCLLLETEDINAFAFDNGNIYITQGMLDQFKNKHQWASVISHEAGHVVLNHFSKRAKKIKKPGFFFTKSRLKKFIKKQEKEADIWAKTQLMNHGFDADQVSFVLARLEGKKVYNSKFHLNLSARGDESIHSEIVDDDLILQIQSYKLSQ